MEFKNLKKKIALIKISLEYNFKVDTAYWFENASSVIFVLIYAILLLLFNEMIFTSTESIGSYDKNMMRFFFTVASFNFFVFGYMLIPSLMTMVRDINTGTFDYNLIRPVPSLFYTLTKKLSWFTLLRDGVAQTLLLAIFVKWSSLGLTAPNVLIAIIIWSLGQYLTQYVIFLFAVTAFKTGESSSMIEIVWVFDYRLNRTIPFDPLPSSIKAGFMFIFPILYTTGVAVSVALGLSNPIRMLLITIAMTFIAFLLQKLIWKKAIAGYTSASS